ncbi:MAG TPA: caspase family protein, partial [Streptosporangiaceae bacterium]|nr:caspase family protein [Streptosporangiaceae bacterium]
MDQGRRFFIGIGTGRYQQLRELPRVSTDIAAMRQMCLRFGYEAVLLGLGEYDSADQIRKKLSLWVADIALTSADVVLIYFAGHGVAEEHDRHYLMCWDSRQADCTATALPTEDLVRVLCQGELRHLLIVLDTCFGGAGSADSAEVTLHSIAYRRSSTHTQSGLWFLSSAQHKDGAIDGAFVRCLDSAIRLATERTGQRQRFIDLTELVAAINERFASRRVDQRAVLSGGLVTGLAPFIPNADFHSDLPPLGTDLEVQRKVAEQDLEEHFGPRSRGVEFESEQGLYFSGRDQALSELVSWLTSPEGDGRGRVVTGSPGCGKSAVLGRIVALSLGPYRARLDLSGVNPATIIPVDWVQAGVHARHKRLPEIVRRIAEAIEVDLDSPTALLQELAHRSRGSSRPVVIVVDALDEAGSGTSADAGGHGEPRRIARELLRPISEIPGVRLLVGTRRELIPSLGQAITVIDLDKPQYRADEDVAGYVRKVLLAAEEAEIVTPYRGQAELASVVAKGVGKRADGVFLVARMTAKSLRLQESPINVAHAGWEETLPSGIGDAFDDYLERFGDAEQRVRQMLLPLAFAEGIGLPRGRIWTTLGSALAGINRTEEDVSWVLTMAQSYLAEVTEDDGRSAYRLYHQALSEHLRNTAGASVEQIQAKIVDALISIVPTSSARNAPDWFSAAPYIRQHLAIHARAADRLSALIHDPGFLLASGQLSLLSALPSISDEAGRQIRTTYEQVAHRLSGNYPLSGRAADLQLSARRCGADELAEQIGTLDIPLPWEAGWAWWSKAGAHRLLSGHQRYVDCVAAAILDGHPVAVTGSWDKTAKIWDLTTQQQIGQELQTETTISSVAVGEFEDYTLAMTGCVDGSVRIWDLSSAQEYGAPLIGHTNRITAIAIRRFADRSVVLTASGDGTARVWDLRSRTQIGKPFTTHRRSVRAAALGELDGRPIAITGGDDRRLYIWELADALAGGPLQDGRALIGFAGAVTAVAIAEHADRLVAIAGDEIGMLSLWDLAKRQQVGEPAMAHRYYDSSGVRSVVVGNVNNSLVALTTGAFDARLWDLNGLRQLGHPLRGHVLAINAGALSTGGDTPLAV